MSQQANRVCHKCDASINPGQRFCSNCGSLIEPSAYQPTELTPGSSHSLLNEETYLESLPPPPPPDSYAQSPLHTSIEGYPYQPPSYAMPQKASSKKVLGPIGCGVLAAILLGVVACSTVGFFMYRAVTVNVSESYSTNTDNKTTPAATTSTNNIAANIDNKTRPAVVPATTSRVNATVKYADVDMTIVDVKQANAFSDESNTSASSQIIRIDLKENNKTAHPSYYYYGDVMRLLLPDGTSVIPFNAQYISGPAASVTRTDWIDFPAKFSVDPSKLILRLGKADEAQMDVPLTNNPDVAKYQPKTIRLNKSAQYSVTNWTISSVTEQLSGTNKQAPKGQMYVIVDLKIDNNSGQHFDGYWGDYIRLQTGDVKTVPDSNSDIPLSADPGQTNQVGTALFLVPQGSTNFTLLLLATSSTGATQQASIPFQVE